MAKGIEGKNKATSQEGYSRDEILKELGPLLGQTNLETGEDRFFSRTKERCRQIFNRYYPDYKNHNYWFVLEIAKYLRPNMLILDAGCGREMEFSRKFQVKYGRFIGVNLEIDAKINSDFCQALHGNLEGLPFKDSSFDTIICRWVIEHLRKPESVFREFNRVLKNDGYLIILAPNKYYYVSLVGRLTPYVFQKYFLKRIICIGDKDVCRVFYKCNTISSLKNMARNTGFKDLKIALFSDCPIYLIFSASLFRLGILYDSITSKYKCFSFLRKFIIGTFRKVHNI